MQESFHSCVLTTVIDGRYDLAAHVNEVSHLALNLVLAETCFCCVVFVFSEIQDYFKARLRSIPTSCCQLVSLLIYALFL
jgi:hypothetical protein